MIAVARLSERKREHTGASNSFMMRNLEKNASARTTQALTNLIPSSNSKHNQLWSKICEKERLTDDAGFVF